MPKPAVLNLGDGVPTGSGSLIRSLRPPAIFRIPPTLIGLSLGPKGIGLPILGGGCPTFGSNLGLLGLSASIGLLGGIGKGLPLGPTVGVSGRVGLSHSVLSNCHP